MRTDPQGLGWDLSLYSAPFRFGGPAFPTHQRLKAVSQPEWDTKNVLQKSCRALGLPHSPEASQLGCTTTELFPSCAVSSLSCSHRIKFLSSTHPKLETPLGVELAPMTMDWQSLGNFITVWTSESVLTSSMAYYTPRLHGTGYCSVGEEKQFPSILQSSWLRHPCTKRQISGRKTNWSLVTCIPPAYMKETHEL